MTLRARQGGNRFDTEIKTFNANTSEITADDNTKKNVTAYDGFESGIKQAMNVYFEKKGKSELKYS